MRVIAGSARSTPLVTPEGRATRPTTDRIKETLFNILQFDLQGRPFLDLFAGSGAVGIEALSRGASFAVFVDTDRTAVSCIEKNLTKCRLRDRACIWQTDALSAVARLQGSPDLLGPIVFLDPPYDNKLEFPVLERLRGASLFTEDSLVVLETSLKNQSRPEDYPGYTLIREKKYKNQKHLFLRPVLSGEERKEGPAAAGSL